MKKWVIISGVVGALILFITILGSGGILKNSISEKDDVLNELELVQTSVDKGDWAEAEKHFNKTHIAWEIVKNRIQFSVERDFIKEINNDIALLKGTIEAKDKKNAIIMIEKIKLTWKEL